MKLLRLAIALESTENVMVSLVIPADPGALLRLGLDSADVALRTVIVLAVLSVDTTSATRRVDLDDIAVGWLERSRS